MNSYYYILLCIFIQYNLLLLPCYESFLTFLGMNISTPYLTGKTRMIEPVWGGNLHTETCVETSSAGAPGT